MRGLTANAQGALPLMASMARPTLNDACMKALSDELPLFQAIFLRGIATTVFMYFLARALGGLRFRWPAREWRLIALRTATEIGAAYFFISALFNMPIANATAILQVLPLAITLAGALFLGEAVGWRRLTAILVGFSGVMLIVRPGFEGFNIYSVNVLLAVVCVTARDLFARRVGLHRLGAAVVDVADAAWRGIGADHRRLRVQRLGDARGRDRDHRAVPLYLAALGADPRACGVW